MRGVRLILVGLAAIGAACPALAQNGPVDPASDQMEAVPFVNTGDQIGIACNALAKSDQDSDVRVVLTISAEPGEDQTGYKKVLATDEEVGHGAVRVRIPTVPDLEDHTVKVDVYVVDDGSSRSCDAGHMKIVGHPAGSGPDTTG